MSSGIWTASASKAKSAGMSLTEINEADSWVHIQIILESPDTRNSRHSNHEVCSHGEDRPGHCLVSIASPCPKNYFRLLGSNNNNHNNNYKYSLTSLGPLLIVAYFLYICALKS